MQQTVFIISDSTAITAEKLGHSLFTQFPTVEVEYRVHRYIDSQEKAIALAGIINQQAEQVARPIVITTLADDELRKILADSNCVFIDFFASYIQTLESALGVKAQHVVGHQHAIPAEHIYQRRIDAVNFALANDDGQTTRDYAQADIILIGVSRSGKTPVSLYLAMQHGLLVANYPLVEEAFTTDNLAKELLVNRNKLFALTISPQRLQVIRDARQPASRYASLRQCKLETEHAELLFTRYKIPYLDVTSLSIEEIATQIVERHRTR